jgi:hypothetical protein
MSRKQTIWAVVGLAGAALVAFALLHDERVRGRTNWPDRFEKRINQFTGKVRIMDTERRETLFYYYDDQDVVPYQLSQTNNGVWIVEFRLRGN